MGQTSDATYLDEKELLSNFWYVSRQVREEQDVFSQSASVELFCVCVRV